MKPSLRVIGPTDLHLHISAPVLLCAEPGDHVRIATFAQEHLHGVLALSAGLRQEAVAGVAANGHQQAVHSVTLRFGPSVHAINADPPVHAKLVVEEATVHCCGSQRASKQQRKGSTGHG